MITLFLFRHSAKKVRKNQHDSLDRPATGQDDERSLIVSLTPEGEALRERAVAVPEKMARCVRLSPEETMQLYKLLYKLLG